MLKMLPLILLPLVSLAQPAFADPPADINACLALSGRVTKEVTAKVKTEAEYVKFHMKMLDLDSACGMRDFATAEKVANELKAAFGLN